MKVSGSRARWWCWWLSNCRCSGLYLPPVFKSVAAVISTPDDHFAAGPHCRVSSSASGRVGGAGGCPTVGAGIVSPAGVQNDGAVESRPRRSFRCRSTLPCDVSGSRARWWCWWLSNCRCWDCIFRRCSNSWPCHLRPRRSFRCRSTLPCEVSGSGRVGGAGGCPTVGAGIISPAGVQKRCRCYIHPRRSFRCRSTLPCDCLGQSGALVVLVAVQLSVLGLYLPPVFK